MACSEIRTRDLKVTSPLQNTRPVKQKRKPVAVTENVTYSPSVPPCLLLRYFQSGLDLSPFTSIFANISNLTPKLSTTYFLISSFGQGSCKHKYICRKIRGARSEASRITLYYLSVNLKSVSVYTLFAVYFFYCIGLSRYIAITNLPIIAVFVEYLRQFLIELNQIYSHSSVPQKKSPWIFGAF